MAEFQVLRKLRFVAMPTWMTGAVGKQQVEDQEQRDLG